MPSPSPSPSSSSSSSVRPRSPEINETHVSILFFSGDTVAKVRKPVRFEFADFSDLESRRIDCEREVALNRRLAPDVYRGTATVTLDGEALEHVVLMRRLPADRNLGHLVRSGRPVSAELYQIVDRLVDFHRRAERSPAISASATPAALLARWNATAGEASRFVGTFLHRSLQQQVDHLAERYLAGRGDLLAGRVESGHVCDGHGDLLADDIFCLDDGPRILDCLEFDDSLRYGDVLADVGFLAMDLERLGAPEAARQLLGRYEEVSGSAIPTSLAHFYVAARAQVRMLVACLRAEQDPGSEDAGGAARQLERLCHRHLRQGRVRVVLVGGLPGTGKSTLAADLGHVLSAQVISTDRVRREMGPALGDERYGPGAKLAVYDALLSRARTCLRMGTSVVLDASWIDASTRGRAAELARLTGSDLQELRCRCEPGIARARIERRSRRGDSDSEATVAVATRMAEEADPWPSASVIDTSGPKGDGLREARAALDPPEP